MNKEMKINAVKNLIHSLDFNREEKESLLCMLQEELGLKVEINPSADKNLSSQKYGRRLPMQVMFEDGTIDEYRDRVKKVVGIVIEGSKRRFVLYSARHYCPHNAPLSEALRYAASLDKVRGKSWRVLTENDCRIIYPQFRNVNLMLELLDSCKIVESKTIGVLTSDGSMAGHQGWQVWFAMDI